MEQLADSLFAKGVEFIEADQPDSAIRYFTEVIQLDSMDANAWENRAIAYYMKGDLENAMKDLTLTPNPSPTGEGSKNALIFLLRGVVNYELENIDEAENDFLKAIELNDTLIPAYENLALIRIKEENFYDAIQLATQAQFHGADIDAIQEYVFYSAGIQELEKGNYLEALSRFDNILTLYESDAAFLHLLGLCPHKLKDFERAADFFTKVLELKSENANEILLHRAHAFFADQQYENAVKDYDDLGGSDKNYKTARRNLFFQKNSIYISAGVVLILFILVLRIFRKRKQKMIV